MYDLKHKKKTGSIHAPYVLFSLGSVELRLTDTDKIAVPSIVYSPDIKAFGEFIDLRKKKGHQ